MNLDQVRSTLKKNYKASTKTLTLSADTFPELKELFNQNLSNGNLVIGNTSIPAEGDIVIKGRGDSDPFKDLQVTATFGVDNGTVTLYLTATIYDSWKFKDSFSAFENTFLGKLSFDTDSHLILSSYDYSDKIKTGLFFDGTFEAGSILKDYLWIFPGVVKFDVFGKITIEDDIPTMKLVGPTGNPINLDNGRFSFAVGFSLVSEASGDSDNDDQSANTYALFSTSMDFKTSSGIVKIPISAKYFGHPTEISFESDVNNLFSCTMDELQNFVKDSSLSSIIPSGLNIANSLKFASIVIKVNPTTKKVDSISFGVYSTAEWEVIAGYFTIEHINLDFSIFPDSSPKLTLSLTGEIQLLNKYDLNVNAGYPDAFMEAKLAQKTIIPLSSFMHKYLPSIPVPANIDINNATVHIQPGTKYSAKIDIAPKPLWNINVGITSFTIDDVSFNYEYKTGGGDNNITGSFGGTITFIDGIVLNAKYDIPGDITIKTDFPTVKLTQIIGKLCDQKIKLPGGFDITFENSTALMQKQGSDYLFMFGTQVKDFGSLLFQIKNTGSKWGFLFGLDFNAANANPWSLAGLDFLAEFGKIFELKEFILVVSTFDDTSYKFPSFKPFDNPAIKSKKIELPAQADGIVEGLNVYAVWQINTSKEQVLLQKLLGLDPTLAITLQISVPPNKNSSLFVSYATKIMGLPLSCKFGGMVQSGKVGIFLSGSIVVNIQGHNQTFYVELVFVTTGAYISGTMQGTTSIDFEVFKLANLAMVVGVDWEGIPTLGVAGTIDVSTFESSIAVLFDSTNPSSSMVAGAISDLTLKDVLDTLTGNTIPSDVDKILDKVAIEGTQTFKIPANLATDLDNLKLDTIAAAFKDKGGVTIPSSQSEVLLVVNSKGKIWYLTDLANMKHYGLVKKGNSINVSLEAQLYCAPQDTRIGKFEYNAGFFINGAIEFFSFKASATIEINQNKGFAVDASMTPIIIGNKDLFSITGYKGKGGPQVSIATFRQPQEKKPEFVPPHFFISGEVNLLGLERALYVNANEKGFTFDFQGDLVPGIYYDLSGSISDNLHFSASGEVKVGVGTIDLGPLGKVSLDTNVDGDVGAGFDGTNVSAHLQASFTFAGSKHNIAKFDLKVSDKPLINLVSILYDKVKDILLDIFKDVSKWAEYVEKGIIKGVSDVGKVLKDEFHKTAKEAAKIMKDAGYTAEQIGLALKNGFGLGAKAVYDILKNYFSLKEIEKVLSQIFKGIHVDIQTPPPHIDKNPHIDTPAGPHSDTRIPPHGDTKPHVDTPGGPHVDTRVPPHGDKGHGWLHWDTPGGPHADKSVPPHVDFRKHIDTPSGPHTDTKVPPHGDTKKHIDTPSGPHIDIN